MSYIQVGGHLSCVEKKNLVFDITSVVSPYLPSPLPPLPFFHEQCEYHIDLFNDLYSAGQPFVLHGKIFNA